MRKSTTRLVIVIGPPGSGKGTQCSLIASETGMIHLSTGDVCREMSERDTDLGRKIKGYLANLQFVPDDLIIDLVSARLNQDDAISRGVLLDGFPRTVAQARALATRTDVTVDRVIFIQVPDEVCLDRIGSRRVDPVNGKLYNLKYVPPPSDEEIQNRLVQRETDLDESVIKDRLHTFHMNIGNILRRFPGKLQAIDGSKSILEIHESFKQALVEPLPEATTVTTTTTSTTTKPPQKSSPGQCVVCMSEPANFLVAPCGHQCGCEGCLSRIQQSSDGKCPICRNNITTLVRVYQSGIPEDDDRNTPQKEQQEQPTGIDDGGWGEESRKVQQAKKIVEFEKAVSDDFSIEISPCISMDTNGPSKSDIAISIHVPDIQSRVPVDICCVIDISGSMGEDAKFQDPNDETKTVSQGMCVLDIVKHAVKAVIYSLSERDRISIVAFDSNSFPVFQLSEMNDDKKKKAVEALEKLVPQESTNIWAGLEAGLNSLRESSAPTSAQNSKENLIPRKKSILLLTDGQPVESPPEGEHIALKKYFEKFPDFKCQVNTFGFGYSLKSKLLTDLAIYGGGTFSFIPDAKIVGTCFVNAVANACSTVCQNCVVHLGLQEGASFDGKIMGGIPYEHTSWGYVVKLGPLYYGQSRDIIVPLKIPAHAHTYLDVTVEFEKNSGSSNSTHKITAQGTSRTATPNSIAAYVRNHVIDVVSKVIDECDSGNGTNGVSMFRILVGKVAGFESVSKISDNDSKTNNNTSNTNNNNNNKQRKNSNNTNIKDPRIVGLNQDVSGRISKSLSTVQRFKRWGQHYLRSIIRAHQLQVNTNFMDQSLQCYGGSLFNSLKDAGGKIFVTLPMKKRDDYARQRFTHARTTTATPRYSPANRPSTAPAPAPASAPAPAPVDNFNTTYYAGSGGGCFDESCTVQVLHTISGQPVEIPTFVNHVKKNDLVHVVDINGVHSYAHIMCVVQIERNSSELVEFKNSGLKITHRHPIRVKGEWYHPSDFLGNSSTSICKSTSKFVYNFILDQCHILLVNGEQCVTFGHGIQGPVTWHPFYASRDVIECVSNLPGFADGFVKTSGSLREKIFSPNHIHPKLLQIL